MRSAERMLSLFVDRGILIAGDSEISICVKCEGQCSVQIGSVDCLPTWVLRKMPEEMFLNDAYIFSYNSTAINALKMRTYDSIVSLSEYKYKKREEEDKENDLETFYIILSFFLVCFGLYILFFLLFHFYKQSPKAPSTTKLNSKKKKRLKKSKSKDALTCKQQDVLHKTAGEVANMHTCQWGLSSSYYSEC